MSEFSPSFSDWVVGGLGGGRVVLDLFRLGKSISLSSSSEISAPRKFCVSATERVGVCLQVERTGDLLILLGSKVFLTL